MKQTMGVLLTIIGALILGYGLYASESVANEVSKFFTGTPTDNTMYMLGAGLILLVAGVFVMLSHPKHEHSVF